jgi:hypothetical protein
MDKKKPMKPRHVKRSGKGKKMTVTVQQEDPTPKMVDAIITYAEDPTPKMVDAIITYAEDPTPKMVDAIITYAEDPTPKRVKAYIHAPPQRPARPSEEELRKSRSHIVDDALTVIKQIRNGYTHLQELTPLFDQIDSEVDAFASRRRKGASKRRK